MRRSGVLWAALLLVGALHGSLASSSRRTQETWSCPQGALVLPGSVREKVNITATGGLAPAIGNACFSLTGTAVLLQLTTSQVYSASGVLVMSVPTATSSCTDVDADAVARQWFERNGLLLAASTWTSAVCCNASSPCPSPSLTIQNSPLYTSSLPGGGWLMVKGYQPTDNRLLASPIDNWIIPAVMTAAACLAQCQKAGFISFVWDPVTLQCRLTRGEPSNYNVMKPCPDNACVYGWRLPGSCGASLSRGIRWGGYQWGAWSPVVGAKATDGSWSMSNDVISSVQQGLVAANAQECNCRCYTVAGCVGFIWLGNNRQCWMFDKMVTWRFQYNASHPQTVTGRVVYPPDVPAWDSCGTPTMIPKTQALYKGSTLINRTLPVQALPTTCNTFCGRDPACQASSVSNGNTCYLYDEVFGTGAANDTAMIYLQRCDTPVAVPSYTDSSTSDWQVGDLSTKVKWLVIPTPAASTKRRALRQASGSVADSVGACMDKCTNTPGCSAVTYSSSTAMCTLACPVPLQLTAVNSQELTPCSASDTTCVVVQRTIGSCGLVPGGIVHTGSTLYDWSPGVNRGTWGTAEGIEPSLQGRTANTVSECACNCAASSRCVGYVFLGDARKCWLQSSSTFQESAANDVSPLTVVGRVQLAAELVPACNSSTLRITSNLQPLKATSNSIVGPPTVIATSPGECNAACLREPFCIGWVFAGQFDGSAWQLLTDSPSCTLYSDIPATINNADSEKVFAYVQRCPLVTPGPPPPPDSSSGGNLPPPSVGGGTNNPSTTPIDVAPSPGGGGSSNSKAIPAVVGGIVGGLVLVAVVLLVLVLRRRRANRRHSESRSNVLVGMDGGGSRPNMGPSNDTLDKTLPMDTLFGDKTGVVGMSGDAQVEASTGLMQGDPFLRITASKFRWFTIPEDVGVPVEEGVTAAALAGAVSSGCVPWEMQPGPGTQGPPPIQLTRQQVLDEIELRSQGLIGRGSSSVVYQCRWRKQFGPHGLLAAKVLRDPYDATDMLATFGYEADVLIKCRHPNVVRIYAYCLEAPTVCLIMELLSGSLRDRLHGPSVPRSVKNSSNPNPSPAKTLPTATLNNSATNISMTPVAGTTTVTQDDHTFPHPSEPGSSSGNTQPPADPMVLVLGSQTQGGGSASNTNNTSNTQKAASDGQLSAPWSKTQRAPPLSMTDVIQVALDVAAGLAFLHAKIKVIEDSAASASDSADDEDQDPTAFLARVVHRDLKPGNVLMTSHGVARISDFGLAREHQKTTIQTDHAGAGTLRYMAPELLGGMISTVTPKVDIFSLGMLMWELVAQEVPWRNCSDMHVPWLVLAGQRPPIPGPPPEPEELNFSSSVASHPPLSPPLSPEQVDAYASIHTVASIQADWLAPADFNICPQFTRLIQACWQHDPKLRPSAATVHRQLKWLMGQGSRRQTLSR